MTNKEIMLIAKKGTQILRLYTDGYANIKRGNEILFEMKLRPRTTLKGIMKWATAEGYKVDYWPMRWWWLQYKTRKKYRRSNRKRLLSD